MKIKFSILLIFVFTTSAFSQKEDLDYSDAITIIEVWLDAQKDYNNYPGLSAAIVSDQEVIWQGAFGNADLASNEPSRTNTIYSICSISKLFTAISIMQLRDEGKLSLESRIGDLLPWFDLPQVHEDSEPITVRSLLTHSSGLPRESNHNYWTGPDFPFPDKESIVAELENQETLYPAGTYFQYSNLGLSLLGAIIEEVSGETYEDYVQSHILTPLNLNDTRAHLPKDLYGTQLAKGYSALDRNHDRNPVNLFQGKGITAAAGISSTVEDLASFASWQFRLLENGGKEILKASTLKEMQRVHFMDPNWSTTWGLGFSVRKSGDAIVVGHGGSCPGYRSQLVMNPKKKLSSVVMFNSGGVNTSRYANGLIDIISKVKSTGTDSLNLVQYTGHYNVQPWGSEEVVARFNNQLVVIGLPSNNPADGMTRLTHIEGDVFKRVRRNDELGETIEFIRDEAGQITHYIQHNNYSYKLKDLGEVKP